MKKLFKSIGWCALLAAAAVSCGKEAVLDDLPAGTEPEKPSVLYRYSFDIVEDPTRATLDNGGVFWEEGDMVGMYLGGIGNDEAEINMDTSPKTVILRSETLIPDGTVAYAYYPFNEANTDLSATRFSIPAGQYGGLVSAMPMAGIPVTVSGGGSASASGEIVFLNLASIIDFNIYSSSYAGETIQSVTFQANGTTLAGDAVLNLAAVDPDDEQTLALSWSGNQSDYVTVRQNVPVASTREAASSIYMVLAPGTYASGTITIVTDVATYTFNYSGKSLGRNELKHYVMNLDNASRQLLEEKDTFPYAEAFTSGRGAFVVEGGTGREWTYDTSYGAVASGRYRDEDNQMRNHEVSTALVSPWINLTGLAGATLSFEHAINSYLDVEAGSAAVYVIAEGDDAWMDLHVPFPERPNSGYSAPLPVSMDLSAYAGRRIRIKFAYRSTVSSCGVWEIKDFVVDKKWVTVSGDFTWNLSVNETASATPAEISWVHEMAAMSVVRGASGTNANNYYGGDSNNRTSTRFYANSTLTVTPTENVTVTSVVFTATTSGYATALANSTWTGATASANGTVVTVTPADGQTAFSAVIGTTCGFTSVRVYYTALSSSGGQGGDLPVSGLPGHLGCFEIPALADVTFSESGNEVLPETNPTLWYRYETGNPKQMVVTHTFKNTTVSPNRMMRSYTLLQDYDKKCALWVACSMNNDTYPANVSRMEKWTWDPALSRDWQPNLTSSYPDKDGFSYDRGHQIAASYRETTLDQVKMTCYFTNMTPQLHNLNTGKWNSTVEANVRSLGENTTGRDTLYVVSGPLFIGSYGTVEDKDGKSCARPTHYFQCFMKVTFNSDGVPASAKGAAYLVEHVSSPSVQYVTIDAVEEQAGFDFFANVPANIQNTAEATATPLGSF